jgi:hypothetical protein
LGKPDYNPSTDPFMQRFDENGNFVNLPTKGRLLYLILAVTTLLFMNISKIKKRTRAGALVRFFMTLLYLVSLSAASYKKAPQATETFKIQ